jgi:hypothetical protein
MDLVSFVQNSDQRLNQNAEKSIVPIQDNGFWDSKMYPDLFKEDIGSVLYCDALLPGGHNHHLRKEINNQKNIVISPLGG